MNEVLQWPKQHALCLDPAPALVSVCVCVKHAPSHATSKHCSLWLAPRHQQQILLPS